MKPIPAASRMNFCIRYVTIVASTITKVTAPDIPAAVDTFFDTPKKGHIPKN
jgi:hypothetical protein